MTRRVGRPSSDDISTEAAKQATDANKIPIGSGDDEATKLIERANTMLSQSAKANLLDAAVINSKKAKLQAKQELEEIIEDYTPSTSKQISNGFKTLPSGVTPDDIRNMAAALPEDQREGFIKQALGMPAGNPLMSAFMQRTPLTSNAQPVGATPTTPMGFADIMQGMMGMMSMSMQLEQKKSEEWRQQQIYVEEQHRRRVEELREARGEMQPQQQSGTNPEVEAYKLQLDMLKETLKENREMLNKLIEAKDSGNESNALQEKILALTQKNLDDQTERNRLELESMKQQLSLTQRNQGNINDLIKQAQDGGANVRMGDSTDLQIQNEHDYKMEQLRIQDERERRESELNLAAANAKIAAANSQTEIVKTLAVTVGKSLFDRTTTPKKELKDSSQSVKTLAGAVQ